MPRNDPTPIRRCAVCQRVSEGEFSIHRDGFCVGPEVWLCNAHGSKETPTCGEIWDAIAARGALPRTCYVERSHAAK